MFISKVIILDTKRKNMNIDMDVSNSDEYLVTALQIFEYCGADSSGTLRVDALIDKFAPFVKTNKSELSYLRSLLDPEHDNPEISVSKLARALNKYSESQKVKVDLDESFNLKSGQAPQDSDSGISTDGFQLLEELQCELREKAHLAHQLRSQLDFTDRQHEETLAAMSAEKEQLRAHLAMLREENTTLSDVRRDYEEACERLSVCELALADSRRELDSHKKRSKVLYEQVATLENEKLTLQEQLSKSKDECHRINEMYASRQSSLLEQNDTLKTEHADLSARLQDQEEFMQQMIKEKVLLEMELKDLLNKSNHTQLRMDRSIDISYTEDQMLTALDTLNVDSRFSQDNRLLDEESFINALREDQGRATNMSLFDEIRLSFCNMSRINTEGDPNFTCDRFNRSLDTSMTNTGTQTDDGYDNSTCSDKNQCENNFIGDLISMSTQTDEFIDNCNKDCDCGLIGDTTSISTQTDDNINKYNKSSIDVDTQTNDFIKNYKDKYCQCAISNKVTDAGIQTDNIISKIINTASQTEEYNNNLDIPCMNCIEYETVKKYNVKLENETKRYFNTISGLENDLEKCEDNLDLLQKAVIEGEDKNILLKDAIQGLQAKLTTLEETCDGQLRKIASLCPKSCTVECQTECSNEGEDKNILLKDSVQGLQAQLSALEETCDGQLREIASLCPKSCTVECQTECSNEGEDKNILLKDSVQGLQAKLSALEETCDGQLREIACLCPESCAVECQTECDTTTAGVQVEFPCDDCVKRNVVTPQRSLRRYLWEPLKCLFQVFAVVCFLCAISVLYGVSRRRPAGCAREPVPWQWLGAQDLMDLLLRIEYVADVPM